MILLRYRPGNGTECVIEYPDDKLDELLQRADAKFLPPLTPQDEIRFRDIYKRMMKRK